MVMAQELPVIDHSLWRYYEDGGKGFAVRRAEHMQGKAHLARISEKETLLMAVRALRRERVGGASPPPPNRQAAPQGKDRLTGERARQALLGLLVRDPDHGGRSSLPIDEAAFRTRIEAMPVSDLQRMAAFLSSVRAAGAETSSRDFSTVEQDLAKRGIALQLSAKTNNVYIAESGAKVEVNANDSGDQGAARNATPPRSQRRSNFSFALGRMTRNFILGH
ncbi:hypothetical protein [Telmatospirillum sp.]|uniref:hypothetical protein n=1 Tax=Telmatospirillum sp. TaxID=2079197 RepID=UPI00283EF422|nr:hypothetical protein [Telmatospirillum sp.]MDR3440105.1 hypothetical protein [Telmatospirillum sp.]